MAVVGLPKAPKVGGPSVPKPRSAPGERPRVQRSPMAPTNFMRHVSQTRRDYSKPEMGAEQPLGAAEGSRSGFGSTGLTGES